MKKIINDPFNVVEETIAGILKAYPHHLKPVSGSNRALVRAAAPVKGKVAIVTGGGSGHLPVFLGYIGRGLCDGVAIGNVFSSPSAEAMLAATRTAHGGKGVLHLFGNYGGDKMNFDLAAELAGAEGIRVEQALVKDDIASAPPAEIDRRRAVAGLFFAYKIAGAKAEDGASLDEVKTAAEKAIFNTRSMGVALTSCIVPAAGKPTFSIAEDEMEFGMGIHGEPGVERTKMKSADEIAQILTEKIMADLPFRKGDEVAALVNGLGATPPEELFILWNKTHDILLEHGIKIHRCYVGEYATSMEMAGCSISLLRLDQELKTLLDAPACSPFLKMQE
ncbi:MAG: dihydroxyacetone kinase subunit DhaK [Kiritimatiellae bacterium]|nr:dihydroxyacetone kinase subunit DhaK [Kiritimatiellia bacterium]